MLELLTMRFCHNLAHYKQLGTACTNRSSRLSKIHYISASVHLTHPTNAHYQTSLHLNLNMPHEPHTPQDNLSGREAPPKKLAKLTGGPFVIVQANGKFKVVPPEECKNMVVEGRGSFSPTVHKTNLEAAPYDKISNCVVIPYGPSEDSRKLFLYYLEGEGTQWLTKGSLYKVLERKEGPDVGKFKGLFETLQAGVDSGEIAACNSLDGSESSDAMAAVSEPDRSAFKTLLKKHAEIAPQLIHLATEDSAEVRRCIGEMFVSDPEATLRVVYPDMDPVQKLFCRALKPGEILSKMSSSILLAYLKSVSPEEREEAVGIYSMDNTKNMQLLNLLHVIEYLENSIGELVNTITQQDCEIKLDISPYSNDVARTC
jgi:hypothetical protein